MSEQNQSTETDPVATVAAPVAAATKAPTSVIKTLTDGGSERMQINAIKNKSDWSVYIVHQQVGKDKKLKTIERGASDRVEDLADARKWVAKTHSILVKDGWQVPEGPKGFEAKPDAFTMKNLPKPGGLKK